MEKTALNHAYSVDVSSKFSMYYDYSVYVKIIALVTRKSHTVVWFTIACEKKYIAKVALKY